MKNSNSTSKFALNFQCLNARAHDAHHYDLNKRQQTHEARRSNFNAILTHLSIVGIQLNVRGRARVCSQYLREAHDTRHHVERQFYLSLRPSLQLKSNDNKKAECAPLVATVTHTLVPDEDAAECRNFKVANAKSAKCFSCLAAHFEDGRDKFRFFLRRVRRRYAAEEARNASSINKIA